MKKSGEAIQLHLKRKLENFLDQYFFDNEMVGSDMCRTFFFRCDEYEPCKPGLIAIEIIPGLFEEETPPS